MKDATICDIMYCISLIWKEREREKKKVKEREREREINIKRKKKEQCRDIQRERGFRLKAEK